MSIFQWWEKLELNSQWKSLKSRLSPQFAPPFPLTFLWLQAFQLPDLTFDVQIQHNTVVYNTVTCNYVTMYISKYHYIQLCLRHTDTRHLTSIDTNRFCCAVFTWSSWSMWGFAELTRMFEKFKFLWFMTRSVFNLCTIPTWSLKQKLVIQTQLQLRHSRKVRPCQINFEVGKVRKDRHDTIEP